MFCSNAEMAEAYTYDCVTLHMFLVRSASEHTLAGRQAASLPRASAIFMMLMDLREEVSGINSAAEMRPGVLSDISIT